MEMIDETVMVLQSHISIYQLTGSAISLIVRLILAWTFVFLAPTLCSVDDYGISWLFKDKHNTCDVV